MQKPNLEQLAKELNMEIQQKTHELQQKMEEIKEREDEVKVLNSKLNENRIALPKLKQDTLKLKNEIDKAHASQRDGMKGHSIVGH